MSPLDLDDIQGLVARGYTDLKAASYVLLQIDDPATARASLRALADQVAAAPERPTDSALNLAFARSGLQKLGMQAGVVSQFSNEFTAGMITPHRQRMFGDLGPSAPERWDWGGPSSPTPDLLLLLFARDNAALSVRHQQISGALRGMHEVASLDSLVDLDGKEHFGFADGISQPSIAGLSRRVDTPPNTIAAGEFILGYPNEYAQFTDRPLLDPSLDPEHVLPLDPQGSGRSDLGRNGTYLVLRQLAQDVHGFWRSMEAASRWLAEPAEVDAASRSLAEPADVDPARRVWLASKLVGRWPSGAPVTLSPDSDSPNLARANDFTYQYADPDGLCCPIGAHVRRSHPRDSLDPDPGTLRSVQLDKRHRLLRRGRESGPPVPLDERLLEAPPDDPERGLFFLVLAANISRQCEFVQHSWVNNPKFDGLYDEPDPLVGYHPVGAASFSIPAEPVRQRVLNLPQFVTTRGGGYFFLPGLRALRYITSLA